MPRVKSTEVKIRELNAALKEAKMELACARVMYEDMLRMGVNQKALEKAKEVITEWHQEITILQNEISAIAN